MRRKNRVVPRGILVAIACLIGTALSMCTVASAQWSEITTEHTLLEEESGDFGSAVSVTVRNV